MSDRIAVMNAGVIEHLATPDEIYKKPKTRFVANFIGESDLFSGTIKSVEGGTAVVETELGLVRIQAGDYQAGEKIHICVRPEVMQYSKEPVDGFTLKGKVKNLIFVGAQYRTLVTMENGYDVKINRVKQDASYQEGDTLYLHWDLEDAVGIRA